MAKYDEWITEEGLLKVEGWARDGLIDEQIAQNMGIAYSTLKDWKKKFSDFSAALKRGKEVIDRQVENALLKRAIGYTVIENTFTEEEMEYVEYSELLNKEKIKLKELHPDWSLVEIQQELDKIPKTKKKVLAAKERHVAGDTTAQIFWLKNRKPSEWRDKQETVVSGDIEITDTLSGLLFDMKKHKEKED